MKIIKKILLVFFSFLVSLFVISMFLPSEYEIRRNTVLDCRSEDVYHYLININNLDNWFYITKSLDSTLKYKYKNDTLNGKSSLKWNGEYMGQGEFEYTNFVTNELIEFKLSFQNKTVFKSGKIILKETNGKTNVEWVDFGENGWNPVNRIFGLFIDGFLGPDMEKSLKKIKSNLDCKNV